MSQEHVYQKLTRKRKAALIAFIAVLLLFAFWDIVTGSSSLTVGGALREILAGPNNPDKTKYHYIVWGVRMPMTLTCICVGASLALAGEQIQTILQNPLASPYTLGISAAAGFGASFGIITGFPFIPVDWLNNSVASLIFALGASALIFTVVKYRRMDQKGMILFGIIVNFFFSALQTLMQYLASQQELSQMMHWMFGSMTKASWEGAAVTSVNFLIFYVISALFAWQLTALSAGEERARSLGIDTDRLRRRVFICSSFLTAVAVSYVGSIGFIGIVAPHLARSYVGEDQRFLTSLSAVFGVIVLLAASILSKILKPGQIIPVGIITNLVGVAFLAYLMLRRRI